MFDTVSSGACENLRKVINKMKISPGQCMPTNQAAVCYLPRVIQSSPPFACLASFDLRKRSQIVRFLPAKINITKHKSLQPATAPQAYPSIP